MSHLRSLSVQGVRLIQLGCFCLGIAACQSPQADTPGDGSEALQATAPSDDGSAPTAGQEPVPSAPDSPSAAGAAEQQSQTPVDLEALLTRAGFVAQGELRVDEFVPVPPGATATAATFGRADSTARAVLVQYPNPRYARPHVTDVLERRALMPDSGDAVLARGSTVIQLRMGNRAQADALAEELRVLLQWETQLEPSLLPPPMEPARP